MPVSAQKEVLSQYSYIVVNHIYNSQTGLAIEAAGELYADRTDFRLLIRELYLYSGKNRETAEYVLDIVIHRYQSDLDALEPESEDHTIVLLLHNHYNDFRRFGTRVSILKLARFLPYQKAVNTYASLLDDFSDSLQEEKTESPDAKREARLLVQRAAVYDSPILESLCIEIHRKIRDKSIADLVAAF